MAAMGDAIQNYLLADNFTPNGQQQPPYFNSVFGPTLMVEDGVVTINPNVDIEQREQSYDQLQAVRYSAYTNAPNPQNNFTNINTVQLVNNLVVHQNGSFSHKSGRRVCRWQETRGCRARLMILSQVSNAITQATGLENGHLIPYPHSIDGLEVLHHPGCESENTVPMPLIQLNERQVFPNKFAVDGTYETNPVTALQIRRGLVHCTNFNRPNFSNVSTYEEHIVLGRCITTAFEYGMFDLNDGMSNHDFKHLLATIVGIPEMNEPYSLPDRSLLRTAEEDGRVRITFHTRMRDNHGWRPEEAGSFFGRPIHSDGEEDGEPSRAGLLDFKEQIVRVLELLQCLIELRLKKYNRIVSIFIYYCMHKFIHTSYYHNSTFIPFLSLCF